MKEKGKTFFIPASVIEELKKHTKNTQEKELAKDSKKMLKLMKRLQKQRLIDVKGQKSDEFADNDFAVIFTKFRLNNNLLLITQDAALADDILRLNESKSVRGNDVVVKRINTYGFLSSFSFEHNNEIAYAARGQANGESGKSVIKTQEMFVKCKLCHKEVAEEESTSGICIACLKKGEVYKCKRCKKEILYDNFQKYVKGNKKHDFCFTCFEYLKQPHSTIKCIECGTMFEFTKREFEFFREKGFNLPKRCNSCLEAKKSELNSPKQSQTKVSRKESKKSSGHRRLCFITTAACEYLDMPDDCYELNQFRQFRDGWLLQQTDGRSLVDEYYMIAPIIVKKLNRSAIKDVVYKEIWEKYLSVCLMLIENKRFDECKTVYKSMVLYLKRIF